jgi:ABC-type transporter Mla subunit MlaD
MASRIARLIVVLAFPAALLTGCGESDEEKAQARVCEARDDIAKQVRELESLTLTTATTSQVKDNLQAIEDDLSTIADATGDLSDELRQDVQAANDEFKASVEETADGLGRTISIEAAATQLEQAFGQLAASYRSTFGRLDCS